MKYINNTLTNYAKLTNLDEYALKDDIPTIPDDLVNNDTLTTTLNEYAKLTNLDEYRKIDDFSVYGEIECSIDSTTYEYNVIRFTSIPSKIDNYRLVGSYIDDKGETHEFDTIFKTYKTAPMIYYAYVYNSNDATTFCYSSTAKVIHIGIATDSIINPIYSVQTIKVYAPNADSLVLKSEIASPTNTTITHYAPIEESLNNINDFVVGAPVYLTGKVYKYDKETK